jgi:hypothetical protein
MKKLTAQRVDGSFPSEVKIEKYIHLRQQKSEEKERHSYCGIIQYRNLIS